MTEGEAMSEPETAAGRALRADLEENGYLESIFTSVEAVEAEARAAALDEARAAVEACNIAIVWYNDRTPLAAIDALRRDEG